MRLGFRNDMHYDFFPEMARFALGGARNVKITSGAYAGGNITIGYIIDTDPKSPTHEQFLEYRPHSGIVRKIFRITLESAPSITAVQREVKRHNLYFPLFDYKGSEWMESRSALRLCRKIKNNNGDEIGYRITDSVIRAMLKNPAYIGRPFRGGQFLEIDDFPAIVDQAFFDAVYEKFFNDSPKPRARFEYADSYPLQGLLYARCKDGEIRPVYSSNTQKDN